MFYEETHTIMIYNIYTYTLTNCTSKDLLGKIRSTNT